eukprot:5140684-Amphidinium_carterae.1
MEAEACENPKQELHDLFGSLRWSTLRQHHRNLQSMLQVKAEARHTRCYSFWKTTKQHQQNWARGPQRFFGYMALRVVSCLRAHKKRTAMRLAEPKRAKSMSMEAVAALELACTQSTNWVSSLAAGHFRFLLGASVRFDGGQHTQGARNFPQQLQLNSPPGKPKVCEWRVRGAKSFRSFVL